MPPTMTTKNERTRNSVAHVGIDRIHGSDQAAGQAGHERAEGEHQLVHESDVEAEEARHLAVLDHCADLDAERRLEEDERRAENHQDR